MNSRRILGVLARSAAAIALVLAAAAAWIYVSTERRLTRTYDIPSDSAALLAQPADTARGRHLATAVLLCTECHGPDLGGRDMIDAPVMRIAAPNLTRGSGGTGAAFNLVAFERALRHAVRADGTPLLLMPSDVFSALADADVAALAAYIRTLPSVDRRVGQSKMRPLGRALLAAGVLTEIAAERIDHGSTSRAIPPADTIALGRYLADVSGCSFCHTPTFAGRTEPVGPPNAPVPPGITTQHLAGWSDADFVHALRTGQRPDGRAIDPFMPWKVYTNMTDAELHAIWRYIQTVSSPPY